MASIWKATFDQDWRLRGAHRKVSILFLNPPTDREIITEFERIGIRLNAAWFEPRYAGRITREKVKVIDNYGERA